MMKRITIIPNCNKDHDLAVTKQLIAILIENGMTVYVDSSYGLDTLGVRNCDGFPSDTELIIVVGGDGSVIDASHYAIENNVPIIGVNLGKVGYLTEVSPTNLSLFERLARGEYEIEEKLLLCAEIDTGGEKIGSVRLAVNDVVISHSDFFGICDFRMENSRGDGVKYRADGLIISTPSGSTAYSLSAGGPVVSHDVQSITITPICPHSFFNRSIIFNGNERITVTNEGHDDLNISVDGRFFANLQTGGKCSVYASKKSVRFLTFSESDMFSSLFQKMRIMEER